MRITVVGVILIVASVVAGFFLLLALNEKPNGSANQSTDGVQEDRSSQYGADE